jgi:hypothetical protein
VQLVGYKFGVQDSCMENVQYQTCELYFTVRVSIVIYHLSVCFPLRKMKLCDMSVIIPVICADHGSHIVLKV